MEAVIPMNEFMELTEDDLIVVDGGDIKAAAEHYLEGLAGVALGVEMIGASVKGKNGVRRAGEVVGGIGAILSGVYLMGYGVVDLFR